MPANSLQQS
ncbi:unnamed protein product, partial [Rotaria sordida]